MLRSRYTVDIPEIPVHFAILAKYAEHGDHIAFVDGITGRSFTFNQMEELSRRVGSGLTRLGARKGDLIALYAANCPEYAVLYLACLRIGVILSGSNPTYKVYEMTHHLKDSSASYAFAMKSNVSRVAEAAKAQGKVKKIITLEKVPGCVYFGDLMKDDGSAFPDVEFDPKNDVAIVPYSSGTTGLPKGVMITHYNIIANLIQLSCEDMRDPQEVQNPYDLIGLAVVPFFHVYGMMVLMTALSLFGARVITLPRFVPEHFLGCIEKYKVNLLPLVPPLVIFLTKTPLVKNYDLSSLKKITCGAAALTRETEKTVQDRFGVPEMKQGYGMTETTTVATVPLPNVSKPGSVGFLLPNTEAKVVDPETKRVLGVGEKGEIWIRGPQVMKGYLNKPEATQSTKDEDGWLHTGDLGYYDSDEAFFITGRLKELIKYKGFQVPPAELESLLLGHPAVIEVAVIGIPNREAGELPRAYIVPDSNIPVTTDEIKRFVEERVSSYKWLRGGVQFVTHIPKTATGKIVRREVAKLKPLSKL